MPSLLLRDWSLAAAGVLDTRIGGQPVYPYQPDAIWEALAITKERDFTYPASSGADLYRRSLYTFWRRTVSPANMFDASSRQACRVRLATTSTPLHALTTLNDPTWVEAARLAGRAIAEGCSRSRRSADDRLPPRRLPPGDRERPRGTSPRVRKASRHLSRRSSRGPIAAGRRCGAARSRRSIRPSTPR